MYRPKNGQLVFTGFIQRQEGIYWVGKDERVKPPMLLNFERKRHQAFFMRQMSQYDDYKH